MAFVVFAGPNHEMSPPPNFGFCIAGLPDFVRSVLSTNFWVGGEVDFGVESVVSGQGDGKICDRRGATIGLLPMPPNSAVWPTTANES